MIKMDEQYNLPLGLLNFKNAMKANTFYEYCRVADALVDINNLKEGKADRCYGILYYPDKMVAKYGSNYFKDFLDYVDDKKRIDHLTKLLNIALTAYITGIQKRREPVIKSFKTIEGKRVKGKITITDVNGNLIHISEGKDGHIVLEREEDK